MRRLSGAEHGNGKEDRHPGPPEWTGKTTFARQFLVQDADCPNFLNADLIAAGLSPFRPETAAIRAARLLLEEISAHVQAGKNFAFETTLSGRGYAQMIPAWRADGYHVKLFFLKLASPELAIARVATRVAQGGHDVPEDVIRRRFHTGLRNWDTIYKPLVDSWILFDNSADMPRKIDEGSLA